MIDRNESYVILGFACADDIRGLKEKPEKPYLVEVAAVKIEKRKIVSHFSSFIAIDGYDAHDIEFDPCNPEAYGVQEDHLIGALSFEDVAKRVCAFAEGGVPVVIPNFFDTAGIFAEHAKKCGLSFVHPVRQFGKTFPIRREFKDGTPTTEIFSEYEIFLLDKDIMMNTRDDLLTWTLAYARLALALMDEEEGEIEDLYNVLFSEYGVTFLEGLETEREDELVLEFCRLAHEPPWDGVKVFTDKEDSVYSAFPTEKICLTEKYETKSLDGRVCTDERLSLAAAEKIAPHIDNCGLIVLDLKLFSEGESHARYRRLSETLRLKELAARMDVSILIPAHFEKPFSAWRNSKQLAGRHVQVVQLFDDRGNYGMEIFGGKNFPCEKYVLLDVETSGLNEEHDRVISVSADKITDGKLTERFFSLVAFEGSLPPEIAELTGIRNEMLARAPDLDTVMEKLEAFRGDLPFYADCAPFVRKFLKKYDLEIGEREKKPLSPRFFDALIDGAQRENALVALCKTDVKYFRDTYSVCEMKIVRAGEEAELTSKIGEIAAEPYDAFVILLRIPKYAFEETIRNIKTDGKTALIGAVESNIFDAVIGCCKRKP